MSKGLPAAHVFMVLPAYCIANCLCCISSKTFLLKTNHFRSLFNLVYDLKAHVSSKPVSRIGSADRVKPSTPTKDTIFASTAEVCQKYCHTKYGAIIVCAKQLMYVMRGSMAYITFLHANFCFFFTLSIGIYIYIYILHSLGSVWRYGTL